MRIIGRSITKIDGYAKVTGAAKYADDLKLPRMAVWSHSAEPASTRPDHTHKHRAGASIPRRPGGHHRRRSTGEIRHHADNTGRNGVRD